MKPNHHLRHEREQRGWSQQKVAEVVGTTSRTVSRWELGLSRPYPYFREQLCALFQKNATELGLMDDEELASKQSSTSEAAEEYEFSTADKHAISEKKVHSSFRDHDLPDIYDPAIPPPPTGQSGLIGRDELLEQVKEQLQVGEQVAITALNGLPGVGKTALAIALATDPEIKARFRDGILWAGLGPNADVRGLLRHWGILLGLTTQEMSVLDDMKAWAVALRRAIGQRRMLLVIDDVWNLEHALALQVGGPFCSHIVTTRLTVLAAQVANEGTIMVPELNEENSLALLNRFIPDIVNQEPETARELVKLVGGLPLAQIIIGRHLHMQSISKQSRRLQRAVEHLRSAEQRLRLGVPASPLSRPANLMQDSPWSLQAAIAVSDQQLDEQARRALRALAVFPAKPNRFSEDAALAVCHVPVEVLDTLSDSGLLESWGSNYYTLHQTIADYARVRLEDQGAYERLLDYYIEYVEAAEENWQTLLSEDGNIMATLDAAYTQKLHEKHIRLFEKFVPMLSIKPRDLYEEYVKRAYDSIEAIKDVDGIITVLGHFANTYIMQGELKKAEESIQRALKLAQQSEDHPKLGLIYIFKSRIASFGGKLQQTEEYARHALASGLQRQDRQVIYLAYVFLGWAALYQGKYQELEGCALEIFEQSKKDNSPDFLSYVYCFLGQKKIAEGDYVKAQEYGQEGLRYAEAMNFHELTTEAFSILSQSEKLQGNYQQAYAYAEEALLRARASKRARSIAPMHILRGELLLAQESVQEAETAFREAEQLVSGMLPQWHALALYGLAQVEAKKGNFQIACQYGEESLEKLTTIGHIGREKVREFVETITPNAC